MVYNCLFYVEEDAEGRDLPKRKVHRRKSFVCYKWYSYKRKRPQCHSQFLYWPWWENVTRKCQLHTRYYKIVHFISYTRSVAVCFISLCLFSCCLLFSTFPKLHGLLIFLHASFLFKLFYWYFKVTVTYQMPAAIHQAGRNWNIPHFTPDRFLPFVIYVFMDPLTQTVF